MTTTTTVGYGDVAMSTPEAKLFACFHIVVSVSWLAAIIGWVSRLTSEREAQLQRANLILNPPNREKIMALDRDKRGVDELEFVVGMLMSAPPPSPPSLRLSRLAVSNACADLGVELCGQPLTWDDVRPFKLQFKMFDVSKTGKLCEQDLERYSAKIEAVKKAVKKKAAKARLKVWAGSRAGNKGFGVLAKRAVRTGEMKRTLQGEIAAQDAAEADAAARVQATIRGRNSRRSSARLGGSSGPPGAGKASRAVSPAELYPVRTPLPPLTALATAPMA